MPAPPRDLSPSLQDLNVLLFRSAAEEADSSSQQTHFAIPPFAVPGGVERLEWCGLAGFARVIMDEVLRGVDRGHACHHHPLVQNILKGPWAAEYCLARLSRGCLSAGLMPFKRWLEQRLDPIDDPLARLVDFMAAIYEAWTLAASPNRPLQIEGRVAAMRRALAMAPAQLIGSVDSTGLHARTPGTPSMAAGLPHFATHHMRCWGRDTFISFRGILLLNGHYSEARDHLEAFAACCFNGLLPNLLDSQRFPRFNARDATWWWCKALRDYLKVTSGWDLLRRTFKRRFPVNPNLEYTYCEWDSDLAFSQDASLGGILREVLLCHHRGIDFEEAGAGPALDPVMHYPEGFRVTIKVGAEDGLLYGGNSRNAGTWMDKMGESEAAGNRGWPSTCRDGAAVEINALVASCLDWVLSEGHLTRVFSAEEVSVLRGWRGRMFASFDRAFYIPERTPNNLACFRRWILSRQCASIAT